MKKIIIISACVVMVAALAVASMFVFFVRPQTWKKVVAKNTEPRINVADSADIVWHYKLSPVHITTQDYIIEPNNDNFLRAMDDLYGYTTYGSPSKDILTRINPESFIATNYSNYKQERPNVVVDGMIVSYKNISDFLDNVQERTNFPVVTIKEPIKEITVPKGSAILFLNKVNKKALQNKVTSAQMLKDKQFDISKDNLSGYHLIKIDENIYRIKLFIAQNKGVAEVSYEYITQSGLVWKSVVKVEVR